MEKILRVLNLLLNNSVIKKYAIGGAMGAMFYAEPISTFDLDIFVKIPRLNSGLLTLSPLYEALSGMGYHPDGEYVPIEGIPVQFLPAYNPLVEEALENAIEHTYSQTRTWVLRVEYLLAIAVQTGREKDRVRVRLLLDEAKIDTTLLMGILDRFSLKQRWLEWIP
jgi:hypothetical protein